jgi:ribosomal protein S18 acetylase RimI-like enzyme
VVSSMPPLQFRQATISDEAVLFPMMRQLAEQEPGKVRFDDVAARNTFRKFLALPQFGCVWLFFEDQNPVGYIVLTIGFSFEFHGHDAFIDELFVVEPYRRRGYGRQAVAFLEKKAQELGVNAVHLEVDEGNNAASELYKKCSYESHERFLMTKWLVSGVGE